MPEDKIAATPQEIEFARLIDGIVRKGNFGGLQPDQLKRVIVGLKNRGMTVADFSRGMGAGRVNPSFRQGGQ